jgi:hypothetical protein
LSTALGDYLSRFNFDIEHVDGITNVTADALSRYYTDFTAEDKVPDHRYVAIDVQMDPDMETLSMDRKTEVETVRQTAAIR